jgi:hypothetical protein
MLYSAWDNVQRVLQGNRLDLLRRIKRQQSIRICAIGYRRTLNQRHLLLWQRAGIKPDIALLHEGSESTVPVQVLRSLASFDLAASALRS